MPNLIQPGLKIVQRSDALVNQRPKIEPLKGRIDEIPVRPVKHKSVVHHLGYEACTVRAGCGTGRPLAEPCAEEDTLAGIRVAHPLIEDEDAEKMAQVLDFPKESIGNEIVYGSYRWVPGKTRSKVTSGFDGEALAAELNVHLGIFTEEILGNFNDRGFGLGNLQESQKNSGDPFIDQDPAVLGVLKELDHPKAAVIRFEQVGLRSPAHFSDQPGRMNWH